LFGGIRATFPNNSQTFPNDRIYKVYITRSPFGITSNGNGIPKQFSLGQNFPNPFNPTTQIHFDIPSAGFVRITVFDILGRIVSEPVKQELNAGSYSVEFDVSEHGSGVYYYRMEASGFAQTKKMVYIK
jgi:hypothetical protein